MVSSRDELIAEFRQRLEEARKRGWKLMRAWVLDQVVGDSGRIRTTFLVQAEEGYRKKYEVKLAHLLMEGLPDVLVVLYNYLPPRNHGRPILERPRDLVWETRKARAAARSRRSCS